MSSLTTLVYMKDINFENEAEVKSLTDIIAISHKLNAVVQRFLFDVVISV